MKIKNLWKMPDGLGGYGIELYRRVGPKLVKNGYLDDVDYDLFIALCESYHLLRMAMVELKADGLSIDGGRGVKKKHPTFAIYRVVFDNFSKLCNHFGLSPLARGEKFVITEKTTKEGKKVERFFKAVG